MHTVPKYWHLAKFNLSSKLSKDEMNYLSGLLVMKNFKRGERIELNHGKGGDVYFLKMGAAKIIGYSNCGEEDIKYLINEGEIFGLLNVMDGENPNDHAVAIDDSLICILDSVTLKAMMEQNPGLNNHLFKLAGLRIRKLERKLEALVYKNAETRIREFIVEYLKDFGQRSDNALVAKNILSNKEIGKLTSTSRQTVNKVLNELKVNGHLHYDKNVLKMECRYLQ